MDGVIVAFDKALRTLFVPAPTRRRTPGASLCETELAPAVRAHSARLMRVNHSGEVCAQALYQGQAAVSRNSSTRLILEAAAEEETEHLNWTEQRITQLGGRKSLLNPFWYAGSLALGMAAAALGDQWSLGFLAETEKQVGRHLDDHLGRLAADDLKSRAVLEAMKVDEARHADTAAVLGAAPLPLPVRAAMQLAAKAMTSTAYWI